mgnify:CR=1 FL=1
MTNETTEDNPMAECGACGSIIPLNSQSCPDCNAVFGQVSDSSLGECGACGTIQPSDALKCINCGVSFVEETEAVSTVQETIAEEPAIVANEVIETVAEEPPTVASEVIETVAVEDTIETEEATEVATTVVEQEITTQEVVEISSTTEASASKISEETVEESVTVEEETVTESSDSSKVIDEPVIDEEETVLEEQEVEEIEEHVSEQTEDVEQLDENISDETTQTSEEDEQETADDEPDSEVNIVEDLLDELDEESLEESSNEEDIDDSDDENEEEEAEVTVHRTITDQEVITAFENLALAIASTGLTAAEAFGKIDKNDDGLIDGPELQKGIEEIGGEKLLPSHVKLIMKYLDKDDDNRVDPDELLGALDGLGFGIKPGKIPKPKKKKEFPSGAQKIIMSKTANDVYYPVLYFLFVTFIGLWVVNGMGLLVDGTGGTIEYQGHEESWGTSEEGSWDICDAEVDTMPDPCMGTVRMGETYPCDPDLDPNKCENSLTIFSGENGASSMPAKFYADGIFMIILGVLGIIGTAYLHLVYAKSLRERAKVLKGESTSDSEDSEDDESEEDSEDGALEAPKNLVIEDSEEAETDEDSDDDADEDDVDDPEGQDEDDSEDDDIDIGSWVGLDIDGDEFFGEIIEFDDDEGTVTIETEDGEEIIGYQDEMFLDDE